MNRAERRQADKAARRVAKPVRPPKWGQNVSSGLDLLRKMQPFTASEYTMLALPPREAFDALKAARASAEDFDTLACVANVALVRCEKIGPEAVQVAKEGQQALMRIKARHTRTGKWGMNHQDITDLLGVIELHEQLIELSSPQDMTDAYIEVIRRMEHGIKLEN